MPGDVRGTAEKPIFYTRPLENAECVARCGDAGSRPSKRFVANRKNREKSGVGHTARTGAVVWLPQSSVRVCRRGDLCNSIGIALGSDAADVPAGSHCRSI